jgi:hypothetical protein
MRRKDEGYSNYWNESGINLSSEFLSYRYLCEDFEKREQKKYKDVEKFCTYSKWEKHILGQKKDLKANGTLDEFIRYLKLKKRNCETANSVYLQYQMSFRQQSCPPETRPGHRTEGRLYISLTAAAVPCSLSTTSHLLNQIIQLALLGCQTRHLNLILKHAKVPP